ncbi:ThiF family adenylyltransferase, partial [Xanthomonas arboricola]|uniref:ThiF family adenylyltransferase n=1 Tax=Xanthomonas arboricola TaxID=56448 RepID=UPI0006A4065A
MKAQWRERFAGIDRLYGVGTVERLAACRVAVVGMGGVGSWVVEALARTGVGPIRLVVADDLCGSNTNRQLPAGAGQCRPHTARGGGGA